MNNMKKTLLVLLGLVVLGGLVWYFTPTKTLNTGGYTTTIGNVPWEMGEATTTGLFAMPTAANQLATSTAWVDTGVQWRLSTATTSVDFVNPGVSAFNYQVCLTSTTTQATLTFQVQFSNHATSSTKVYFPETVDTVAAQTTHAEVYHSVSFATTTTAAVPYKCENLRISPANSRFVRINMRPNVNVLMWSGVYSVPNN